MFAFQSTAEAKRHLNPVGAIFGSYKVCRCCFLWKVHRSQTECPDDHLTEIKSQQQEKGPCSNYHRSESAPAQFSKKCSAMLFLNNISVSSILRLCINSKTSIVTTDLTLMRPFNSLGYFFNPSNWSFNLRSAEKLCVSYFWNMQYHTAKPDSLHS